jgi:adenosine/AMP kinase
MITNKHEIDNNNRTFKRILFRPCVVLIRDAYPINVLTRLKEVSELVNIYCATANPIEVIFVETEQGRAILGVVDGFKSKGIEAEKDVEERKHFLRKIGYKM